MDELTRVLSLLSENSLRLLLDGRVTLMGVRPSASPHQSPPDYVSAIVDEARHMPADLQANFLDGTLTIRQVRTEILRRHVAGNRLARSTAALFETCSVDLATICASVGSPGIAL